MKQKLNPKEKNYQIHDSPLYKLKTKKKLCTLLCLSKDDTKTAMQDNNNYVVYDAKDKNGNGKSRNIQYPNERHQKIHYRIANLLTCIQLPKYVHSGRKKHSYITNAKQHLGDKKVLTTDIKSFYQSTTRHKVFCFFLNIMKCEPDIADILSHICTYNQHIPTGSQLSTPLAFWSNFRMFNELETLCIKHNAIMSVYVDDIIFSGDAVNRLFRSTITKIIDSNGHKAHPKKTMMFEKKDRKPITGTVINGETIDLQNKHYKKIRELRRDLKSNPDIDIKTKLIVQLTGLVNAFSIIAPKLKKNIKKQINKYE